MRCRRSMTADSETEEVTLGSVLSDGQDLLLHMYCTSVTVAPRVRLPGYQIRASGNAVLVSRNKILDHLSG